MTAKATIAACREAGITLAVEGVNLRVKAYAPPPPGIRDAIRENKADLVRLLATPDNDRLNWTWVAEAILAGGYDSADRSTRASLRIGLEGIPETPVVREALARIQKEKT